MNVFVGYDSREDIVYRVCKYSILKHNCLVNVIPIVQKELRSEGLYYRGMDVLSSTEFSLTRFLVPHLSNYRGWSLFCDCDFVWLEDIQNLFDLCDNKYAVMVVKHNYKPKSSIKMDGKIQTTYPRKNWSSMILWNCNHSSNKKLTIETINTCDPSYLHQFKWLKNDEIGEVPVEWNWLVGWNTGSIPKAIHYTEGGPWFDNYKDCEYNHIWNQYYDEYSQSVIN
jgi:lipopolysaccharide biosynthesis glycosyltransferase